MTTVEPLVLPVGRAILREIVRPSGARVIAINSGIGAGKSTAIAQGVHAIAMTRPGCAQLVSAGTYGLLMSVLQPRLAAVIGPCARWYGGTTRPRFEYANGSLVELVNYRLPSTRSEASNPWEGRDYVALWVDEIEQLPDTVFDHSFQRCRLRSTDAVGREHEPIVVWSGRPGAIYHWMEKAEALRDAGRRVALMVFPTSSNHTLAPSYLENLRATMDPDEFDCVTQSVIGARMPVQGAIYRHFSARWARVPRTDIDAEAGTLTAVDVESGYAAPLGNVIDMPAITDYPTYVSIDFGIHTAAVVWVQEWTVSGRRCAVIVDEWCPDEATDTRAMVSGILARGWHLVEAICDPAGDARKPVAGLASEVRILRREVDADPDGLGGGLGVPVCARVPPVKSRVRDGVMRVSARILDAAGDRSLLVRRALWDRPADRRGVRQTVLQYEWDPVTGDPKKGERGRHADHMADAIRLYVIRRAWDGLTPARGPDAPQTAADVAAMFGRARRRRSS